MSTRMSDALERLRGELRHEPTAKRVRAELGGGTVVDTTAALLVWEPRRITPTYAVPEADLRAAVSPATPADPGDAPDLLHPGIPFAVHSTPGEALTLTAGGTARDGAAFRPADPDLAGYVLLDLDAVDAWYEEDERGIAHPRDPYHSVDARRSSRHVRIADGDRLLAESSRPTLVFESHLPVRFYLPREDVVAALQPSDTVTCCPYKGWASYLSAPGRPDVAWSYREPLPDAAPLAGLVAFYDDVLDVTVDGVRHGRADTAVARSLLAEFGVD